MRNIIIGIIFCIGLTGCAAPLPYGNFLQDPVKINQKTMANDAVKRITALYPPGKTHFKLQQATPDVFGSTLVEGLRLRGYAILAFDPETDKVKKSALHNESTIEAPKGSTTEAPKQGLPLHYILDQLTGTASMYRVTLVIGHQTLSRLYSQTNSGLAPTGSWVHKD